MDRAKGSLFNGKRSWTHGVLDCSRTGHLAQHSIRTPFPELLKTKYWEPAPFLPLPHAVRAAAPASLPPPRDLPLLHSCPQL